MFSSVPRLVQRFQPVGACSGRKVAGSASWFDEIRVAQIKRSDPAALLIVLGPFAVAGGLISGCALTLRDGRQNCCVCRAACRYHELRGPRARFAFTKNILARLPPRYISGVAVSSIAWLVERGKTMIKKTSLKTGQLTQRPGFLKTGSIIFASGFALALSALAGNMNLPEQNMLSSNALQAGRATQQTQADLQTALQFPNVSEAAADIGDDALAPARATVADFNGDGHPDYVLRNASTLQTAIWYLNNSVFIGGALGPTLPAGWSLDGVANFNYLIDVHPDYALFNATTDQTGIWYMSGATHIASAYGPTLHGGWDLVATGDLNNNGYPDYMCFTMQARARQRSGMSTTPFTAVALTVQHFRSTGSLWE